MECAESIRYNDGYIKTRWWIIIEWSKMVTSTSQLKRCIKLYSLCRSYIPPGQKHCTSRFIVQKCPQYSNVLWIIYAHFKRERKQTLTPWDRVRVKLEVDWLQADSMRPEEALDKHSPPLIDSCVRRVKRNHSSACRRQDMDCLHKHWRSWVPDRKLNRALLWVGAHINWSDICQYVFS